MRVAKFHAVALCVVFALAVQVQAQDARHNGDVTTVQDNPSKPLLDVISSQAQNALGRNVERVWVGYSLTVRPSMRFTTIQAMRNGNSYTSINNWQGEDRLPGVERIGSENKDLLLLFERGDTRRPAGLSLIDSSEELRFKAPLIWIENVSHGRSLAAVIALAEQAGSGEMGGSFMALVAAHSGDKPGQYFLNKVRSGAPLKARKSALFWYGSTLESGDLGELVRLEGELKETEMLKQIAFAYHRNDSKAALDRLASMARTSSDPEVAGQAIFWIGNMDNVDPVPLLRSLYKGIKSSKVREKVIFAASRTEKSSGLDFLTEVATTDPDSGLREKAIFWIGNSDAKDALARLKSIYSDSQSTAVKEKIIFAISRIETKEAFEHLAQVARSDSEQSIREKAIFWIGSRDEGEEALALLSSIYSSENMPRSLHEKVLFSASRIDSDASLDFLTRVAKSDPDSELRKKAIFWISNHDNENAVVRKLKEIYAADIGNEARESVLFAASRVDTKDAALFLLNVARTEQNRELRKKAIFWLSRSDSAVADQYIEGVLNK